MHIAIQILQTLGYLVYCYIEAVVRLFVPVKKKSFAGKLVLVTGAGHGIGKQIAIRFSEIGARLVLWDIHKENLEEVVKEIQENGHTATSYICDVTNIDTIKSVAERVRREVGQVEVLVNNAGILNGGALMKLSEQDIRRTFDINILAYFWTCREVLPYMIGQNEGHIINVASMSAEGGVAYLTDYSATKWAVKGFSQALKDEMRREGHSGINITTVYPMFVNTGMTNNMIDRLGRWLTPEEVAAAVVDGAQLNKISVYIPSNLNMVSRIQGLLPTKFVTEPTELMYRGIGPQYKENKE